MSRTKDFLKSFLERTNIPGLGTKEGRQAKYDESKKNLLGMPLPEFGVSEFLQMPDRSGAIKRQEEIKKEKKEGTSELGDPYNRKQYNEDLRNMMLTGGVIREYEAGREAKRNMAAAQQYFQMAGAAQETAARRRLMEDQFSPTKISQQKLRAQQGEAVLMNAIANQGNTAVNISTAGLAPRGRAGGR
tara:strand:- start:592 stop:1155 length:564 start_codon:yes stop_codon:yes gene_type:complete